MKLWKSVKFLHESEHQYGVSGKDEKKSIARDPSIYNYHRETRIVFNFMYLGVSKFECAPRKIRGRIAQAKLSNI